MYFLIKHFFIMRNKIESLKVKKLTVDECTQIKGGTVANTPPIIKPTGRPRPWIVVLNM